MYICVYTRKVIHVHTYAYTHTLQAELYGDAKMRSACFSVLIESFERANLNDLCTLPPQIVLPLLESSKMQVRCETMQTMPSAAHGMCLAQLHAVMNNLQ
jgi:hypothetical protein